MKYLLFPLIAGCISLSAAAQNTVYNKALADSLGADQYGMKMYQLVILKTGSNQLTDKEKISELFRGHMSNMERMVKDGKLAVAGPFGKNDKQYRGIFILSVKTKEEAEALLQTDPAVQSKMLEAEIYPWYGSAALPKYLEYHSQIVVEKP
ncbi:MAG: YciI family protein [Chitinophaga sp.]